MRKLFIALGILLLTCSAFLALAGDSENRAPAPSDWVEISEPSIVPNLTPVASPAILAELSAGGFCLDCDTHADCDRLCGSRGFFGGACLRDLDQVCSIYPDDKVCSCF